MAFKTIFSRTVVGLTLAVAAGALTAFLTGGHQATSAPKATILATLISRTLNYAAVFSIVTVPAVFLAGALVRRKYKR